MADGGWRYRYILPLLFHSIPVFMPFLIDTFESIFFGHDKIIQFMVFFAMQLLKPAWLLDFLMIWQNNPYFMPLFNDYINILASLSHFSPAFPDAQDKVLDLVLMLWDYFSNLTRFMALVQTLFYRILRGFFDKIIQAVKIKSFNFC
jgi:hypothetical protein